MKKIILSTMSLALVFSLVTSSVSAQNDADPVPTELAEHVPGELLIRFSPGMNPSQAANKMNEMGLAHKREIQGIGVHLVKLPPGLSVAQALDRFSRLPGVEFVEPNYILHIADTSRMEIVDQWGLKTIRTEEAWDTLNENQKNEILLATVDTGINRNVSDLSPAIWTNPDEVPNNGIDNDGNGYIDDTWGWDFVNNDNNPTDDHMHGSAVTSVMAAAQDGAGMVGICPWCEVMAVKVLDSQGSGNLDVVASGIIYAAQNGARVINLSLAGSVGSQTLQNAVNYAWNQGSVVVAAAGNDGQKLTMYPAGYANAIAVASTNSADKHSCFSNYNTGYISVAAPGQAIYVVDITNSDTGYNYYSGTSLSTPHVAGLAGLILGKDPSLTNAQVRTILEDSAVDLGPQGIDAAFGHGRIDAFRAITGDFTPIIPLDSASSTDNTASGYAHARKFVRDSSGILHLIWHTVDNSLHRIRYATSVDNGNTWVIQPDVFSSPYETYHSALAADNTYLYVAIPSRGNASAPYQILFSRKPLTGGTWSSPVSLMGGVYHTVRPDLYLDPTNGRLHVIASSLDDAPYLYYRSSNTQGASWGNLSQFNPSNSTSNTRYASVYANGDKVYIATRTVESLWFYTYYYLYTARSTNGGATWIDQTQLSYYLAFTSGEYGISLAGIGDRLYMGYEVGSNIYFRRNDGNGWGDLNNFVQLETGDVNNVYKWPSITQADDGQAWMTFEVNGQLYMRHYNGATWDTKQSIGTGNYSNLKRGVGGDRVEWVSTICNGSPFDLVYNSLSLGINSPPQADNQALSTNEDMYLNIVLNGSDPDGDPLTFVIVNQPTHGTLSGTAPTLTYTPNSNYNGSDSFTFKVNDGQVDSSNATVAITMTAVNDAPVANDQAVTTVEDTLKAITLTASDIDNASLTYSVVGVPTHGTLSGTAPNLIYTPTSNYDGPDGFTFKANDGQADSNVATVLITVTAVNSPPVSFDQAVTTDEDTPKDIALTASDSDADPLTFSVVSGPTNGSLGGTPPNLTYTPNSNYNGPDSFIFNANDGQTDSNIATVSITISPVNDPPAAYAQEVSTLEDTSKAITLNAMDVEGDSLSYAVVSGPSHGTLSGTPPNLTYTPGSNYNGPDSFTFRAGDGQADSSVATVTITVTPVNDPPVAYAQTVSTLEDTPQPITLTATDGDGDLLTYSVVSYPAHGSLSGTAPNLTYTPNLNYNGSDSFTFKVNDAKVDSNIATISITIMPVDEPADVIYVGSTTNGNSGGVAYNDEDIVAYNTSTGAWSMYFDGSDVGITGDVDAFGLMSDGSILLSLEAAATVGSLGTVDDSDIIRFIPKSTGTNTAGTFTWYFDGSDVGLTTNDEDIDAIDFAPDGRLIFSTLGSFSVTGVSGDDEDLIAFTTTSLGLVTSGTWSLYFDGSDVGLTATSEDVNGVWIDPANSQIYLTTSGAFAVTGASGNGADIFICMPGTLGSTTSCTFSMYWDGSAFGFAGEVADGITIKR